MQPSLGQFLQQVARRGSWLGGGSVAAVSAALAAALLEKLVVKPQVARRLRRIRRECLRLAYQDAAMFARVIQATRSKDRRVFKRRLKAAIDVPLQVFERAHAVLSAGRSAKTSVSDQFQSDLRCVTALARASSESARVLISTNLAWLSDAGYASRIRRRMRVVMQRPRR